MPKCHDNLTLGKPLSPRMMCNILVLFELCYHSILVLPQQKFTEKTIICVCVNLAFMVLNCCGI